ncbi:MAG TPA: S8 family serine peptidase [Acidobacteriota bacterium]|nr:S8 family serine peptidase [Acidobacteriota bacterium]
MHRTLAALVLIALFTGGAFAQSREEAELSPLASRLLVKFDASMSEAEQERVAREFGAEVEQLGPYADFVLLRFATAPSPEEIERLAYTRGVVFAERETRYRTATAAMPLQFDDPLQPLQWAHRMINIRAAHDMNFGSDPGVTVAVLDTGIAYLATDRFPQAPDLAGTIVLTGYDFVSDDVLALDEGDGLLGHGTFLAGVIAQSTHNGRGTAGIAFNASLMPVRIADRRGVARASNLARGIRFAVAGGASLVVLGVAGPDPSRAVEDALKFAYNSGVPVIAPAGNSEVVLYPARHPEVLSVGAVDAAGERAYYSPADGPIDIYAPGGDMRPEVDADADGLPDGVIAESFLGREYRQLGPVMMEGTSAAAAHVAGAAALLLSQIGPLPPERLYKAIRSSARKLGDLSVVDAARLLFRASKIAR